MTPLGPTGSPGPRLGTKYWLGVSAFQGGKFEEALSHFRRAVAKDPSNADAWFQVGYCCGKLGRLQDAIDAFKHANRIKPDYAEAHHILGLMYLLAGNKASALEEYKILKDLDRVLANELFNRIYP